MLRVLRPYGAFWQAAQGREDSWLWNRGRYIDTFPVCINALTISRAPAPT